MYTCYFIYLQKNCWKTEIVSATKDLLFVCSGVLVLLRNVFRESKKHMISVQNHLTFTSVTMKKIWENNTYGGVRWQSYMCIICLNSPF